MQSLSKSTKREWTIFFILLIATLTLTIGRGYPQTVTLGISIWATSVLPSLFPYAFLSASLSRLTVTHRISKRLSPLTKKVFNTGGVTAYAFVISIIAGYPIGSKTVSDLKKGGFIGESESVRASALCSTSSPIFLISTVGCICFNSFRFGLLLLCAHLVSSIIVGFIFSFYKRKDKPIEKVFVPYQVDNLFYESVFSAINSCLFIGGVITLFTLANKMLLDLGVLALPIAIVEKTIGLRLAQGFVFGLIECTSGIIALGKSGITFLTLPLCGFLCSFGGICILMQSLTYLKGAKIKTTLFLLAKLLHGGLCFCICLLFNLILL